MDRASVPEPREKTGETPRPDHTGGTAAEQSISRDGGPRKVESAAPDPSPRPPGARVCGAEAAWRLRIHPSTGGLAVPGDSDGTAPPASERTRRKKL